jgi:hypothetical protein
MTAISPSAADGVEGRTETPKVYLRGLRPGRPGQCRIRERETERGGYIKFTDRLETGDLATVK